MLPRLLLAHRLLAAPYPVASLAGRPPSCPLRPPRGVTGARCAAWSSTWTGPSRCPSSTSRPCTARCSAGTRPARPAAGPSTSSTASSPGRPTSLLPLDGFQFGASELCGFLDAKQIRRGLITRNVKDAVDLFHQRFGMMFVPALSREFCPYKPDPAPLLHICSIWNIPPNEVLMVGDSLKDDIVCGKRARAFTCLLDETGRYGPHDSLPEDVRPDFKVSSLSEVLSMLEEHFDLAPGSTE